MAERAPSARRVRAARLAVAVLFFVNGALLASWVPHVPGVQTRLALGPGVLGVALLAMAAGALVTMPIAGACIARAGSRRVLTLASVALVAALPLPLLAPNLAGLMLALLVFGAANGAMDVAMNAQALAVERLHGRPIFSTFHGLFSVGGIAGAAAGGGALRLGLTPVAHGLAASAALGALAVAALTALLSAGYDVASDGPRLARPTRPMLSLGAIAFVALMAEGSMADWSALYLRDSLATDAALAAAGFAVFSGAMAVGRLTGDRLTARLGAVAVVRASGLLVALGLGTALVVANPTAAIVGFGCVGAGLANVIPVVFRAAGELRGVPPGHGIAAVTTAGYVGFLAGPPLIGGAAELVALPGALGLVVLCGALISVYSFSAPCASALRAECVPDADAPRSPRSTRAPRAGWLRRA